MAGAFREKIKRQKLRLFARQQGKCHYCKQPMLLSFAPPTHKSTPRNLATLEHLDHKFSPDRGKHSGEHRRVLACWGCNNDKGREALRTHVAEQRLRSFKRKFVFPDLWEVAA